MSSIKSKRAIRLNLICVGTLLSSSAWADVDVGRMVQDWRREATSLGGSSGDRFHRLSRRGDGIMRLLVTETASGEAVSPVTPTAEMLPIRPGLYAWAATPETVAKVVEARPDLRITWSAPRRVMMDQAVPLVRADIARDQYGLTGKNVVVGIVDTGLDIRHADLRNADGKSRIAWLLDMSHEPVGLHPELEAAYRCSLDASPCAVYSGADLDRLMANGTSSDEPVDTYGHGTHVASLAAGNGLSSPSPKYVGMAPDATIVAVRATRDGSGVIDDPDILSAVAFIFDVADNQLKQPAVVNLSLGGDFGAHDGTSKLEVELGKFMGPNHPGHSVVVAAGNSGLLYYAKTWRPNPLGIHTVAQVTAESSVRVPFYVGASAEPKVPSQVYIWVASRPGDQLKVGLDSDHGTWIAPIPPGPELRHKRDSTGDYDAEIQNGVTESEDPSAIDHSGAVVLIEGTFPTIKQFALRLEGRGTASIWIQPAGGVDPALNQMGALFTGALREGTVGIPGTARDIISVGAYLDHLKWTDINGIKQLPSDLLVSYYQQDEVLEFSAAGPSAVDTLKPDVVAPGGWVAGAMSRLTDPRTATGQDAMFTGTESDCMTATNECMVVDDTHALSSGTSMASPIVAGAVALLLERNPGLIQSEIIQALQAGAGITHTFYSPSQVGAGLLNVENALWALDGTASDAPVSLTYSWIGLGNSFVRPDSNWPIEGIVHLRDADDHPVEVPLASLKLRVQNGNIKSDLERLAPGYFRFIVTGAERTAGESFRLELLMDGKLLLSDTRDIVVDAPNNHEPTVAGRGCSIAYPGQRASRWGWLFAAGAALLLRRRSARIVDDVTIGLYRMGS
ncbi:MAG TPA: S8 family serine peptidase [Polyangiaceae bacterium]